MYSPIVIVTLGCSITTLLHLIILKHESVTSTTLHRLHPLLLHPLLLLMTKELHIWDYDIVQLHMEILQCHDIAAAEEICIDFQHKTATYSEPEFRVNIFIADTSFPLARHVVGPQNTRTLTVLGWTDDPRILNATLYPDHVQKDTPQFMTALFNIGRKAGDIRSRSTRWVVPCAFWTKCTKVVLVLNVGIIKIMDVPWW